MLKTIKLFFQNQDYQTILLLFIIWKAFLFFCMVVALVLIPLKSQHFLGGGFENYHQNPYIFPWLNFDGEHYLSIAMSGYKSLEHAFFPLYPLFINVVLKFFPQTFHNTAIIGLIISNVSTLLMLIILYKLIRLDYSKNIALATVLTMLLFPTSFYYQAFYTESLFLLFILLTFYFSSQKKWWQAALFGIFGSATRVFGFLTLPAVLIDLIKDKKKINHYYPLLLIPLGLMGYMFFLWKTVGDPLAFYNLQLIVGEQHQRGVVLFPQVVFRYLKILSSGNFLDPQYITFLIEFLVGILFFVLPIVGFFLKVRWSYLFFSFVGFLLPTIQGSFSSSPRYILILFPSFLILTILISKLPKVVAILLSIVSLVLLGLETMLFVRGYWVA